MKSGADSLPGMVREGTELMLVLSLRLIGQNSIHRSMGQSTGREKRQQYIQNMIRTRSLDITLGL